MTLEHRVATRYVQPLREGGSLPAIVDTDGPEQYVLKFRGAGQGVKALVAEAIAGGLAQALELPLPGMAIVYLAEGFGSGEPDPEIQDLLRASVGNNFGIQYLSGALGFDPKADETHTDATLASSIVWFDALITNVDRTPRNTNLLCWHAQLWLIDHGASLYFHHGWRPTDRLEGSSDPFVEVREHVLLPWATALGEAAAHLGAVFTDELFDRIVEQIPASWLASDHAFEDEADHRAAYVAWLRARAQALPLLLEEAERAHAQLV